MNFLKTLLASILGTLLAFILLFLIVMGIVVSSSTDPEPYVRSNTVLNIKISGDIPARISPDPFEDLFSSRVGDRVSLQSLKRNLEKAAADDNIAGVLVEINQVFASWPNLETAYGYFEEFRESGKFLYFNTDDIGMNERAYFLASTADSIFSPPETNFEFDGFVAQLTFYREFLDNIGIEPEIFRVGKYKSAVEPYLRNESSPESREQINAILDATTTTFVNAVEKRTGKSADEIHDMLNSPPINRLQFAVDNGLIDELVYSSGVEEHMRNRIGLEEDEDLRTISFGRYSRVSARSAGLEEVDTSDKIAVIYASGMILPQLADSPFGPQAGINYQSVKRQIDSALDDDNVKAIVLHVNSPGGAATTSDLIWNHVREAAEKKPVVASMGNVAASGGYYIAIGADTVVASPNTVTGSIGIFNLMFNAEELYNDKLGIRFESLPTHEYSDLFNLTRPLTSSEARVMQKNIENGYESFLNVVAESRGMTRDEVHEVAQGRVWTGEAALEAGLIDLVGDLDYAIGIAAEMAEIEEYNLDIYPKRKDLFESLFGSANTRIESWVRSWIPGPVQQDVQDIQFLLDHPAGMNWALLPIHFEIN